jgi:hypothetical protein
LSEGFEASFWGLAGIKLMMKPVVVAQESLLLAKGAAELCSAWTGEAPVSTRF